MWYETAKPFVESGELAILGVVQEQHAERARLYKQWKQFDFPIVQDASTQLDLNAVPIPIFIDEHGIVRNSRPRPKMLEQFVAESFEAVTESSASANSEVDKLIEEGNVALHSAASRPGNAISVLKKAVAMEPKNGKAKFALGVAYRMRFDSPESEKGDFENASRNWSEALAINPNQYIWRRRIEQYGPRADKPYPFYDWVDNAVADIKNRGDSPVKLSVGLTQTEIAKPGRRTVASDKSAENPDADAKIFQDENGLVDLSASAVPAIAKPGAAVRVHLQMRPLKGKWNNEAGPLMVWINEESTGTPEQRLIKFEHNPNSSPVENRNIDFEFQTSKETRTSVVDGFILFHVCDDEGVCFYYRKNFKIEIGAKAEK